jgi:hypothetical protein
MGFASAIPAVTAKIVAGLMGTGPEDDDAIREFVPPWMKNSELVIWPGEKTGQWRVLDMSFSDPFNYLKKPVVALLEGKDWKEKVWGSFLEAIEQFAGEEILARALVEVAANKKLAGGRVSKDADPTLDQIEDRALHVLKAIEPGVVSMARNFYRAATGYENEYKKYELGTEAMSYFGGARVTPINPLKSLEFKAGEYASMKSGAEGLLRDRLNDGGPVEDSQISKGYRDMQARLGTNEEGIRRAIQAAEALGYSRKEILKALTKDKGEKRGLPEEEARRLVQGKPERFTLPDTWGTGHQDRRRVVRGLMREDRERQKQ